MKIALKSHNGLFVAAELGGGLSSESNIAMYANRTVRDTWETYNEIDLGNGKIALQTYLGNYVTAELNGDVSTDRISVGEWEQWEWVGNKLRSHHGTFLSARLNLPNSPIKTADVPDIWEEFTRILLSIPSHPSLELDVFPRRGCSIASSAIKNTYDYKLFAQKLSDCGMNYTGINIFSAQWPSMVGNAVWPFIQQSDGQWDIRTFNPAFLDRILDYVRVMHEKKIHVTLTLLELYGWSNRKKGPDTPDANVGPFRNNINGIKWGGLYNGDRKEDDETLTKLLPGPVVEMVLNQLVSPLSIPGISWKLGNEFPEKSLHEKMRNLIRAINPTANIIVNRNEDTAGQYFNMKIPTDYNMIEFHGWDDLGFLKKDWGGPDEWPNNFDQFFKKKNAKGQTIKINHSAVICNSDGARANNDPINTYHYDNLFKVFELCVKKKMTIDHQSRVKISGDLNLFENSFCEKVADL